MVVLVVLAAVVSLFIFFLADLTLFIMSSLCLLPVGASCASSDLLDAPGAAGACISQSLVLDSELDDELSLASWGAACGSGVLECWDSLSGVFSSLLILARFD